MTLAFAGGGGGGVGAVLMKQSALISLNEAPQVERGPSQSLLGLGSGLMDRPTSLFNRAVHHRAL